MSTPITVSFKNFSGKRARADDGPMFQGRNGLGIQTGIVVSKNYLGHARLNPISSKGLGTGFLSVPVEEIDAVCAALQQIKQALTK